MQKLPKGLQIWHIIRGDTPHRVLTVVMVREVRSRPVAEGRVQAYPDPTVPNGYEKLSNEVST